MGESEREWVRVGESENRRECARVSDNGRESGQECGRESGQCSWWENGWA